MKKLPLIWALLFFCVLSVLSVLAWQTVRLLSMEKSQLVAEAEADIQGKSRLALSRIDSAAANLLIIENRRSISEFKSFSKAGEASTLLTEKLEFINLHFEMDAQRMVKSPQVVSDFEKQSAIAAGASEGDLEDSENKLKTLRLMLESPSSELEKYTDQFSNIEIKTSKNATVWSTPLPSVVKEKQATIREASASYKRTRSYQADLNVLEKDNRAKSMSKALNKAANEVESQYRNSQFNTQLLDARGNVDLNLNKQDDFAGLESVYPMQPIWLNDDLLLVRKVTLRNEIRYQGSWVKTQQLRAYFETLISDLLPNSRLEPAGSESDNDALSLVSLPFRLVTNASFQPTMPQWSPLRSSLLLSWLAALISIAAVSLMIKSILRLSERRASFVSAVTHELRTPLTTFKLYSEMLSEGMVKDEVKKKEYLMTMKNEADRLSHLVENVLSYSEIERGSARAIKETLSVESMMERISSRFKDRVREENATFDLQNSCGETELCTDVTAIEQILFNLVDNACKYGLPVEGEGRISISTAIEREKDLIIKVADNGRGINQGEKNRLFKPFHKSAFDAANDKPGVGLGLSLCRRTATKLGGSLTLEKNKGQGAVFVLRLPIG